MVFASPSWDSSHDGVGERFFCRGVTNLLLPLICALTPNMVGVALMIWMRELAWWLGHEEI